MDGKMFLSKKREKNEELFTNFGHKRNNKEIHDDRHGMTQKNKRKKIIENQKKSGLSKPMELTLAIGLIFEKKTMLSMRK
ncbi:MAG: hypothetical protein RL023_745 [Candidatus Parcubacteria bacterium]|jgi:hypothetical protein